MKVKNWWCETCQKPFGRDEEAALFHQDHYGHRVFSREVEVRDKRERA